MDINEIKVGERYWWNGVVLSNVHYVKVHDECEVVVDHIDTTTVQLIKILVRYMDAHPVVFWVHPSTLSPLPEHEDAK